MPKNVLYIAENALSSIQGGGIVALAVLEGIPSENFLGFYDYRNITPIPALAQRFVWLGFPRRSKFAVSMLTFTQKFDFLRGFGNWLWKGALALRHDTYAERDLAFAVGEIEKQSFRPELVYFSGLSLRYLELAVRLAEHFDLPMIVLHMDDWMAEETHKMGSWGSRWRKRIDEYMRRAARRSVSNTTNSPRLAKVVTEITGVEYSPANNCCSDMRAFLHTEEVLQSENPVPVITYAGALNFHLQGETLLKPIVSAIAELNAEGTRVELHIYTPWEFAAYANSVSMPGVIIYKGQVSRAALAEIYARSDFLLTTVTFREKDLLLFKHSLSTKLSEYLSIGKPVISAGHPDWHLHEYVEEHNCGWSIKFTENYKRHEIKEKLRYILSTGRDECQRIGESNRLLWENSHNVNVMARGTKQHIWLA